MCAVKKTIAEFCRKRLPTIFIELRYKYLKSNKMFTFDGALSY